MNDRNNTIECLKYLRDRAVISDGTITEQSDWIVRLCDEVLELLKEQEPRVLTLEEVEQAMTVWGELSGRSFETMPLLLDRIEGSKVRFVSRDVYWYLEADKKDYAKSWRCWSSRPTEEQREAVKWME